MSFMLAFMFACLRTSDLAAAGWDAHRIKAATKCCLRRLRRGHYVVKAVCSDPLHGFVAAIARADATELPLETTGLRKRQEDLRILVRSFVGTLPDDAVFSHRSALIVHGLPVPYLDPQDVHAEAVHPRNAVRQTGLVVRRRDLPPEAIITRDGVPVTSLLQTLLDVARDCPVAFAVPVVDSAVRDGTVTLDELRSYCRTHPVRTGQGRVASVLANVDGTRETLAESICAVRFVEYGITGFVPQLVVRDDSGRFLARTDFGNESARVIAEFDGAEKYFLDDDDPHRAFELERRREYALRNEGWIVFRIRWRDLFEADVFLRIRNAVQRREAAS